MKKTPSIALLLLNLMLIAGLAIGAILLLVKGAVLDLLLWAAVRTDLAVAAERGVVLIALLVILAMPLATIVLAVVEVGTGRRAQGLLAGGASAALLLIPISWVALGPLLASREEARASGAWSKTLDPIETFTDRYPTGPASAGAVRVNAAAERIGVEMIRRVDGAWRVAGPEGEAYEAVRKELGSFVSSQTQKADETPDAPPSNVTAWLSIHQVGIADLTSQILRSESIAFETDWSVEDGPSLSLLGFRGVGCALVVQALEKTHVRDWQAALEALEAAWRVGGAVRDRGELVSQLMGTALDQMTLGALRKVQNVPESWHERITEHDYRASVLYAFEADAWRNSTWVRRHTALRRGGHPAPGWLWLALEGPCLRLMAANYSLALSNAVGSLKQANFCSLDAEALEKEVEASLPIWNFLGKMSWPSLPRAALVAEGMSLEVELTERVFAARRLKANGKAWPARLPGLESRACPGAKWIYAVSDDGSASLTFDRKLKVLKPPAFRSKPAPTPVR